jgi:hypothetical protein
MIQIRSADREMTIDHELAIVNLQVAPVPI